MVNALTYTHTAFAAMTAAQTSTCAPGQIAALTRNYPHALATRCEP